MALSRVMSQVALNASRALATPLRGAMALGLNHTPSLPACRVPRRPLCLSVVSPASKVEGDLVQFLSEEIQAESKNLQQVGQIDGFKMEKDGADLKLIKEAGGEKIIVQLNVNHTVDSAEPDDGTQEAPEMKSKPNFEIDIVKPGGKTLSFSCSFIYERPENEGQEEAIEDVFAIDEVTMFEGETWTEKNYSVAGDILDGYLYDLFMNLLDERGINAEFANKLSDIASSYEHTLYIKMLEDLQQFAKK